MTQCALDVIWPAEVPENGCVGVPLADCRCDNNETQSFAAANKLKGVSAKKGSSWQSLAVMMVKYSIVATIHFAGWQKCGL